MENPHNEFMRTVEAARYLQVSRQFLETARCRGDGPRFSKIGRAVIYKRSDLDDFITANRHSDTASAKAGAVQQRPSELSPGGLVTPRTKAKAQRGLQ
jgi:hypothetical protein